jgi:uroporphyrinogen III methyltransferase / synthase
VTSVQAQAGKGALEGLRVVVTRATDQAGELVRMLEVAGAEVVEFPTIRTVPPKDTSVLDCAIESLAGFDYVIFTSANALKYFMSRMEELGRSAGELEGIRIVCVGPKTAQGLAAYGLSADILPGQYKAEGVLAALEPEDVSGKRFLMPRAEVAREEIPDGLRARGAEVVVAIAYRTVAPEVDPEYVSRLFADGGVSAVTFTSTSTVVNFVKIVGDRAREYLSDVCVACIGSVTAKTCEDMGIRVSVVPEDYTVGALFDALTDYFKRREV